MNEKNASGINGARAHYIESLIAVDDFAGVVRYYENHRIEFDNAADHDTAVILRQTSRAYASLTNYPVALKLARLAQTIFSSQGDTIDLAETFMVVGGILRNMVEMKEAEKAFRDAESIFRRNDCPEGQSRALNLLAGLFFRKADYSNALSVLLDAIQIAKKQEDSEKLAYMMGNIGRIYSFMGNFDEAEKHMLINIEMSQDISKPVELARAYMSLGYLYIQKANYENAKSNLTKAAELLQQCNSPRDEVMYMTYLGELEYRMGEVEEARRTLLVALCQAEKIAPESSLAGRVMRHLAEVYVRQNNFQAAQRLIARAMVIMTNADLKAEIGALKNLRAKIAEQTGNKKEARELFINALDELAESGVHSAYAEVLIDAGRSEVFKTRDRMTYLFRAENFYRKNKIQTVVEEIEYLISGLGYIDYEVKSYPSDNKPILENIDFITASAKILRFKSQLPVIAGSDLPILLTGQTGVGKDRMAAYFHSVARPNGPFRAINCASIPEPLLESELFGYQKGAFTGADHNKTGLFEMANGGVLYLDEIGDMPLALQTKLLGVLQSWKITPVGSTREIKLDIKLVTATNRNLEEMVEKGTFRRDLYYRISGIHFHIDSLKNRKEDIPLLLKYFLKKRKLFTEGEIPSDLLHLFVKHDWPGNTRELDHIVLRLQILTEMVVEGDLVELTRSMFDTEKTLENNTLFNKVEQFERKLLVEAMLASRGNKSEAARILGIHEATIRTKLKRYDIRCDGGTIN